MKTLSQSQTVFSDDVNQLSDEQIDQYIQESYLNLDQTDFFL